MIFSVFHTAMNIKQTIFQNIKVVRDHVSFLPFLCIRHMSKAKSSRMQN